MHVMETRFHMQNDVAMVEHTNIDVLRQIRKYDGRFKRRRIKEVLQAYPSQIKIGTVYLIGTKPPQEINGNSR